MPVGPAIILRVGTGATAFILSITKGSDAHESGC
jgi:hypothetical protein